MATTVDISRLGVSALLTAQRALSTTGHNIANVNTEGFSRQRVDLQTRPPQEITGFQFGKGVDVQAVRRLVDETASKELRAQVSNKAQTEAFLELASQIDGLLADADAGLSPILQSFFNSVQELADDPSSAVARQVVLGEADNLTQRFQIISQRVSNLETDINNQLRDSVSELNGLAESIATVNRQIVASNARAGTANDLLDRRDLLVSRVAELANVSTVDQDDGTIGVFLGTGQALVLGAVANSLQVSSNPFDPTRVEVANSVGLNITGNLSGGRIGGLVDFRDRVLDSTLNSLDRVAAGLGERFNAQHRLGMDLNGNLGGDFFAPASAVATANANNTGGTVAATLVDVSNVTTSNYTLRADGGNLYTLTRESDGQTFAIDTLGASPFTTASIDGFTLTITAGAASGDSFRIRPVANAAAALSAVLDDPRTIAAASPVRIEAPLSNRGDVLVRVLTVASVNNLPLSGPPVSGTLTATFDATLNQFTLVPDPFGEGPLAYDPATESGGKAFTLLGGDVTITLAGVPADGDMLILSHNTGGVGDNRNALTLAGLETGGTLAGGSLSLQDAYGQLVAEVGSDTRDAQISDDAFGVLLDQAQIRREQVSGVNLDEEAADLLRFQQAYQAAARLITVSDSLFQTLLGAIRG